MKPFNMAHINWDLLHPTQLRTLLAIFLVISISWPSLAIADTLTIVHVNDTHSHLASGGRRDSHLSGRTGGIARAATMIGLLKATEPNVLTLHAGDAFIGDLFFNNFFGVPELRIMAAMGFDAMTLGNHEFDLGPDVLTQALDSGFVHGGFPILAANCLLDDPDVARLRSYVAPYMIKNIGGHTVGIFGLTTPSTNLTSNPAPVVIDDRLVEIATNMVDTLTHHGCDVIILLSHLGIYADTLIAANVGGLHAIIGGHDHYLLGHPYRVQNPSGDTTWIAQAGAFYHNVGSMRLSIDNGNVRLLDYRLIPLDESVPEEPSIKAAVAQLIDEIESVYGPVYSQQIAHCAEGFHEVSTELNLPGFKDTPIGNIVTDAFRAVTGAQIGIEPGGSTAEQFYPGPITADDAFRVVGYGFNTDNGLGFRMVTFNMTGAAILAGIEFGLSDIETNDEFLLQVSGMRYSYNPSATQGSRLVSAEVGGEPIKPDVSYSIVTNEFLPVFLNVLGIPYTDLRMMGDTTEFHLLAAYVAQLGTLQPIVEGRITATVESGVKHQSTNKEHTATEFRCYPDPFTDHTIIQFTTPTTSNVRLDVLNSSGETIAVLVDEKRSQGAHTIVFEGNGLPTGNYFCRLKIGADLHVRLLHLVR